MPKQPSRDGVFQRKDRSGWWISFVDASGIRRKKRVEAHTRPQALKALAGVRTGVEKEKILGVRSASDITTAELLARYRRHQKSRLRATTYERLIGIIEGLETRLPRLAKEISRLTVDNYVSNRAEEVAAGTVAKEITVLKHALRFAVQDWKLLNENPAQGVRLPKVSEGRTRYLTPKELKAALAAAPQWMKAPIALAALTGMRRGELLGLRWLDVDLEHRHLYLRETKNGTLRIIAINDLAHQVLTSLPRGAETDLVFEGVDAHRLTVYTRRLFAELGIEDASFHSLRHTAASLLVMKGADLYTVGQLLGHKTPRMTQRYAHLSPGHMAAAVAKLNDVLADSLAPTRSKAKTALARKKNVGKP
jgi:integrase